tara:strand:- start:5817 stop:6314 length:498 start_codon:yes stop_codon:yes gene_type:complete
LETLHLSYSYSKKATQLKINGITNIKMNFLKPSKKKIISTIIILLTMFVTSSLQEEVVIYTLDNSPIGENIETISNNLSNLTEEQKAVMQEIVGDEVMEYSQEIQKELESEDFSFIFQSLIFPFFKEVGKIFIINTIIEISIIYISVCYILSFSIKGKAYKENLE